MGGKTSEPYNQTMPELSVAAIQADVFYCQEKHILKLARTLKLQK